MFERYTESARRTLFFSRFEASQLGSISIEPEHLLLGIVREGALPKALLPVPLERLRVDLESRVPFKEKVPTSVEIPFSAASKRVLQFAAAEADLLRHAHIGSEHLLLGVLREDHCGAAAVLGQHGVRLSEVRDKVAKLPPPLESGPAESRLTQQMGGIKAMVQELARSAPGTPEAVDLSARICNALDHLIDGGE
jgi:ATP-dependent Clp protease ATP-binding subunit ClpC